MIITEYDRREKQSGARLVELLDTDNELTKELEEQSRGGMDFTRKTVLDEIARRTLANAESARRQDRAAKVIILQKQIL